MFFKWPLLFEYRWTVQETWPSQWPWSEHLSSNNKSLADTHFKHQGSVCMKKQREDNVLFTCLVSWLFLMQSFTQQSCMSLLHILCILLSIFLETSGIIVILLLEKLCRLWWQGLGWHWQILNTRLVAVEGWGLCMLVWFLPPCLLALIGLSGSWC